jgi:hypothetical protein
MDESGNQYVTGFGKSVPRDLNGDSSIVFTSAACKNNDITSEYRMNPPVREFQKWNYAGKTDLQRGFT